MRRLFVFLLLLSPIAATDVIAQRGAITVICTECRDPHRYPADWANFAFNQIFGDEGWMNVKQADDFFIVNLKRDKVYVDVDFVMGGITVLGLDLPLWPKNMVMITLALPNGTIVRYIRSVFQSPLPVPAPDQPGDRTNTPSDENEGDEGIDDDDLSELPEPDDLPEIPEWCEEC